MTDVVKNLYNVPSVEMVRELLYRRTGLRLDNDFATYTFSPDASSVTIGTKARASDGRRSPYVGQITLPLSRVDIGGQLPNPLIWSDNYPSTVQAFADYLMKAFNYYMEDGEFFGVGDANKVPLVRGGQMTAVVNPTTQTFRVEATAQALRWLPGTEVTFRLATSNSLPGQNHFQLTGTPPAGQMGQPYDFTFQVLNGVPPYRFRVQQGTPPITPDILTGRMQSAALTAPFGPYNWIMEATDAQGNQATLRCSMNVAASVMQFNPPVQNPTIDVGVPQNILLGISGGRQPYILNVTIGELPDTAALSTTAITGIFDGTYTAGQTSRQQAIGIEVTDQDGQNLLRIFTLTIRNRSDAAVIASLKAKLQGWYPTPLGELQDGFTWTDASGHVDLTVINGLTKVTGPHNNDQGLSFAAGRAIAQAALHNFTNAFTLATWAQMAPGGANDQHLISKASPTKGWALSRTDSTLKVLAATAEGLQSTAFAQPTLTDGNWHLVIAKITPTPAIERFASLSLEGRAPTDGTLFDGVLVANSTQALGLGWSPSLGSFYTGALCDPVIFNDTLWADEIRWFANSGAGRHYWELIDVTPLSLSGAIGDATQGTSASFSYVLAGGVPPYTVSISAGALPPNRTIDNNATVNGSYTTGGDYSWTVKAVDTAGSIVFLPDDQHIAWSTLTVTGSFPDATAREVYEAFVTVAGGNGVYSGLTVPVGSIPDGLVLTLEGNKVYLRGTPTAEGSASFSFKVVSGDGQSVTTPVAFIINAVIVYPTLLLTGTLPGGTVGNGYTAALTVSGGNGHYLNPRVDQGSLPDGLAIQLSATAFVVTGTPTTYFNGQVTFAVDSADIQTATAPQTVQITAPDTAAARRGLRAKITSFWDFNQRATDQGRAGLTFVRSDNAPITYVQAGNRYATVGQKVAYLYTASCLGVNAIHSTDRWTFGGRFKPTDLGYFFASIGSRNGGFLNELLAIGTNAAGNWIGTVRDVNSNTISLTGPLGALNNRQHVCLICDGTTLSFAIDGQMVASAPIGNTPLKYDASLLRFVLQNNDATYHSAADCSELFFAHDALTINEIGYLSNLGAGRYYSDFGNEPYLETSHDTTLTALLPYSLYPLGETTGTAAVDSIGTLGNGVYSGATLGAYEAPYGVGGKAPKFAGNAGVALPATLDLGNGDVTLFGYYHPDVWTTYGRLMHLGTTAATNASALTVNNTTTAGRLMSEGFNASNGSLSAAVYPFPILTTAAWMQTATIYNAATQRLAIVKDGLTASGVILNAPLPAVIRNQSFLMRSGLGEYGNGGLSRAAIFKKAMVLADLCKLHDLALPPLALTGTLGHGATTQPYTGTLTVTGGNAPLNTPVISNGSLPAGLTMAISGRVITFSGTASATSQGTSSFTITVSNAVGESVSLATSITIDDTAHLLARLRLNGADGSTSIADDAGKTWTVVNGAVLSAAQFYEGGASLACITGGVQCATNIMLGVGTTDFTLRGLFYPLSQAGTQMLFRSPVSGCYALYEGGAITWYEGGTKRLTSSTTMAINGWHSFAISRAAGILSLTIDATVTPTTLSSPIDFSTGTLSVALSYNSAGTPNPVNGYLDFVELFSTADATRLAQLGLIPLHLTGTWSNSMATLASYNQAIALSGGTGTYTNSRVTAGTLPVGLTLAISGGNWTLSGTPSVSGPFSFTAAIDSGAQTATVTLSGTVALGVNPSNYDVAVTADNPKARWKLTDTSGTQVTELIAAAHGTAVFDQAKRVGPSLIAGSSQSSLAFGDQAFIRLPTQFVAGQGDWTYETVIQPMGHPTQGPISAIMQLGEGGSSATEVDIVDNADGTFEFRCMVSGVTQVFATTLKFPYGVKLHLALRMSAGTVSLWVGGVKVGEGATSFNYVGNWIVGAASFGASIANYPMLGYMSEIAYYNAALPDARIMAHAAAQAGASDPKAVAKSLWAKLEAWYTLDEATDVRVLKDSRLGRNLAANGTLTQLGGVPAGRLSSAGAYAQVASASEMAFTRNFAIVSWAATTSTKANTYLANKWSGTAGYGVGSNSAGTNLSFKLHDGQVRTLNHVNPVNNGAVHFVSVERAMSLMSLYQDITVKAAIDLAITMNDLTTDATSPFTLFAQASAPATANNWVGSQGTTMVFKDALTNAERAYLYNGGAGVTWAAFRSDALGPGALATSIYSKLRAWWEYDAASNGVMDRHIWKFAVTGSGPLQYGTTPLGSQLPASVTFNGGLSALSSVGAGLALRNEVAALLWTQPAASTATYPKFMWKGAGDDAGGAGNYTFQCDNVSNVGQMLFRVSTAGSETNDVGSVTRMNAATKYLFGGQRRSSFVEMYVNGAKEASANVSGGDIAPLTTDTNPLTWGYRSGGQDPVNGLLMSSMLFHAALTVDEHGFLYNSGAGRTYAQLVAAMNPDAYAATALSLSPVFYYDGTEPNGKLLDFTGHGNAAAPFDGSAQYRQASIRPDGVGYAIALGGTSTFVVPQVVSTQAAGWMSFWAKPSISAGEAMLYCEGTGAGPSFQLKASYLNGSGLTWEADNLQGSTWQKQWSGALDPSVAHHIVVTWDATHKCIYVDGVQVVNVAVNGAASTAAGGQSYIGREQRGLTGFSSPYQGTFQGLCAGSVLLTADQAALLFTSAGGTSAPGVTSRFWKINILTVLDPAQQYMNLGFIGLRGEPGGANLAYNNPTGTAAASSSYAATWLPIYAFNRAGGSDPGASFWHSAQQSSGFWISYDFGAGKAVTLREIAIQSWNVAGRVPGEFEVQTSDDGVNWVTVGAYKVNSWDLNAVKSFSLAKGNALAASLMTKMVGWWPMNETTGTQIKDVYGGNHANFVGSHYALGQPTVRQGGPTSLQWTANAGADTWAVGPVIPGSLTGPKDRSCYTWWKSTAFTGQSTPIELFLGGEDETSNVQMELLIDTSKRLGTLWEANAGDNITTVGPSIVDTNAHFIGYSMDATNKKVIYTVDTVDSAPVTYATNPSGGATAQFFFGCVPSAGTTASTGYQQDSVIFASQLTVEEKRWLYNNAHGRDFGTVQAQAQTGTILGAALYDALVSWWEFKVDGVDSHGYNPFLVSGGAPVTPAIFVPGKLGNAIYSPGSWVSASVLDVVLAPTGGGSMAFWYKAGLPATPQVIASIGNSASSGETLTVGTSSTGVLSVAMRDTNANIVVNFTMGTPLDTTSYHFVVYQKTPTGVELWVDNVLVGSAAYVATTLHAFSRFCLGSDYSNNGAVGAINQPAWFNRSLSPQEIAFLWNQGKGLTYGQLMVTKPVGGDTYSAVVLAKNPVGYWRLNDTGPTAVDLSGNGLHGVYTNNPVRNQPSLLPNGLGASTTFGNASGNALVVLPTSAILNGVTAPLSVEAWVKPSSLATEVIYGGGSSSAQLALSATTGNGKPYFGQSGVSNAASSTTALVVNTANHVVATVDALGQVSYIVNGKAAGGPFAYSKNFQGAGAATIGRYSQSDAYPFTGGIQEVAVYNRAITLAEAQSNFVAGGGSLS